jgi:hypothetical protein
MTVLIQFASSREMTVLMQWPSWQFPQLVRDGIPYEEILRDHSGERVRGRDGIRSLHEDAAVA